MRAPLTGGTVDVGAVLRPTPGSGAHAAGRSGGKGSLEFSGRRSSACPVRRGCRERELRDRRHEGARHDRTTIVQATGPRPHGEDGRELHRRARNHPQAAPTEPDPGEKRLLIVPDASIRERTGRGWEEWFDILDEWGAADRPHRDIAKWVASQLSIEPLGWNAQAITGSYERARRGREVGQMPDGFRVTATKTVAVPVERLYEAFVDPTERNRWLPDIELRSGPPPRRSRPGSIGTAGPAGCM